tara:strand:- start:2568 stop:3170 length:603 start_codon:yes stop_codon:yes gene_type:complete
MSLFATSFLTPQFQSYKAYWLKFYQPGTTTAKTMATDQAGGTLVSKAEVNNEGFTQTAGGTIFIPFVDNFYDAYLFPTEADADLNNTASAVRIANNINASASGGDLIQTSSALTAISIDDSNNNQFVVLTPDAACTITLNSSTAGTAVSFLQDTLSEVSFVAGPTVAIISPLGYSPYTRYSTVFAYALSNSSWLLGGDLG